MLCATCSLWGGGGRGLCGFSTRRGKSRSPSEHVLTALCAWQNSQNNVSLLMPSCACPPRVRRLESSSMAHYETMSFSDGATPFFNGSPAFFGALLFLDGILANPPEGKATLYPSLTKGGERASSCFQWGNSFNVPIARHSCCQGWPCWPLLGFPPRMSWRSR